MADFGLFEYIVVGVSLIVTLTVGLYTSYSRESSAAEDYMLGGRRMKTLPIAMSLAASTISGSVVVSLAQESYLFGMNVYMFLCMPLFTVPVFLNVYLPVVYNIRSVSAFEFYQRRFNKYVRRVVSFVFILDTIQHTAISQFVPAVTFSQACGYSPFTVACVFSGVCMGYTMLGGLKSVTWADTCQAIIMVICSLTVLFIGTYKAGGPAEVIRKAGEGYRGQIFDFNWDPSLRYTAWSMIFANIIFAGTVDLNPTQHQRYVAMPNYEVARKAALWNIAFTVPFSAVSITTGIVAYAYFAGCDPVLAQKGIRSHSTIIPYFVNQVAEGVPGIMGLFHAGVIAAGMSTTTSYWNTLSCTVYDDLINPFLSPDIKRKHFQKIMILLTTMICLLSTSFVYLLQGVVTQLLSMTMMIGAVTRATSFVLLHAGMFLPWVNSKGVTAGGLSCAAITFCTVLNAGLALKRKDVVNLPKLLTTANCSINGTTASALNMTLTMGAATEGSATAVKEGVNWLSSISLYYYPFPGVLIGLTLSLIVSWLTGGQDLEKVDPKMIVPQMRWALPTKTTTENHIQLNVKEKLTETYEGYSIDGYRIVGQDENLTLREQFQLKISAVK